MIVFLGGIFRDLVTITPKFPVPGETVMGSDYFTGFGGKSCNQCVAAKLLGADVAMIGKLGQDDNGRAYMSNLEGLGINTDHIELVEGLPSGVASIFVNSSTGENQIVIVSGANIAMGIKDVESAAYLFQNCTYIVCALETQEAAILAAFKSAKSYGAKTILNAAPARSNLNPDIIAHTDILCINESEAQIMTGNLVDTQQQIVQACLDLNKKVDTVILTLGARGAAFKTQKMDYPKLLSIDVKEVKVVDTTGAGDAFVGALAYFLSDFPSLDLEKAIEKSCYYATESVKKPGTQSSYLKRSELPDCLLKL